MVDVLKLGAMLLAVSALLMLAGAWFSLSLLDTVARKLRIVHDWMQLRIKARIAGLIAYRAAVEQVIRPVAGVHED